jgi:hypothetical protein
MALLNRVLGRPISSVEDRSERVNALEGVAVFGLDSLGSAAYGPEAALAVLLPLGVAGRRYLLPLTEAIVGLLIVVFFSYRQTTAAYPGGGGAYRVVSQSRTLLLKLRRMVEGMRRVVIVDTPWHLPHD